MLEKRTIHKIGQWMILALVVFATACSPLPPWAFPTGGAGMSGQASEQDGLSLDEMEQGDISQDQGQALLERGQPPVGQDAPPTPPLDVITVDLDAGVSQETERSPLMKCTSLDGVLLSVIVASNPLEMAQALHMQIQDEKIQVMLVLDGADVSFLQEFEVEIGKQSGDQVQAFVPIARLCDLANEERVLAVYPPSQAILQQ
jgi:hypothetical protein